MSPSGEVIPLFDGIIDNQMEHQINQILPGPDGMMYVATGPAGNSAVMGAPTWRPGIMVSPTGHTTPCEDIVLTGRNFQGPNFLTPDPDDMVLTGAYVPFGTETMPGQVIPGAAPRCGGAILRFDPADAGGSLEVVAWGFRNVIGIAWDAQDQMYATVNGFDIRGLRPVKDFLDATYRVVPGEWYGWPDFSAGLEPLTDPKFEPMDMFQAPVFIDGVMIGK